MTRFRARPGWRQAIRRELGLAPDAPVVGIVAALRAEKNHGLFLRAANRLRAEMPDAQFVIVGDGPERDAIRRGMAQENLSECVHLLGARADIPEVLAAMNVFTLTSHIEANPVSILEAMAMGLPVVATNVGSVGETVLPGVTGFLASAGKAEELAGHWADLLTDSDLARQMGVAARDLVVEKWSLQAMIDGYQDLISEVYKRKCSPQFAQTDPMSELETSCARR